MMTSDAPISSKIEFNSATKPRD